MNKLSKLLFSIVFIASTGVVSAQELGPQWGENATQEQRHENALRFNFYRDAYNSQRYDDALKYLPDLVKASPKGAQNIYVYAINIYKNKIQRATDIQQKGALVDSLFGLYDLRMEHFGDDARYGRPYILIQKAKDYLNFKPTDRDGLYGHFRAALDANAATPDPAFINIYFNELTNDFLAENMETEAYLTEYEALAAMMDGITDPAAADAKSTFDSLFISSGAATCENVEEIQRARVSANPDDLDTVAKAFNSLNRAGCTSPFFFEVAEKYFELQPTTTVARIIAKAYDKTGNSTRSTEFLKLAIENETDQNNKAILALEISGMELGAGNARSAAEYAEMAHQLDPDNGLAYEILAQAYSRGSSGCEGFDRQTVYWLAYDLLARARSLYAEGSEEMSRVDESMRMFRNSFPNQEDLFFRGHTQAGASYDVRCGWISGRTTVKM